MTTREKTALTILALAVVALLACYVWPTAYYFPAGQVVIGNQAVPVASRVSRFGGNVQVLTIDGWKNPTPAAAPAPQIPTPAAAPTKK